MIFVVILDESSLKLLGIFKDKYELIARSPLCGLDQFWDEYLVSLGCLRSPDPIDARLQAKSILDILDFVVIPCPGTPFHVLLEPQFWSEYGVPECLHIETTRCIYIPKDLALKTLVLGGLP